MKPRFLLIFIPIDAYCELENDDKEMYNILTGHEYSDTEGRPQMKTMVEMIREEAIREKGLEMDLERNRVATDMLAKGCSIEFVSDISKLDIEKVKEIAASMGK